MFKLNTFIIENLKKCVETQAFSKEQASIFALNYYNKGQITEEEFQTLINDFQQEEEIEIFDEEE